MRHTSRVNRGFRTYFGLAAALLVAGGGLLAGHYLTSSSGGFPSAVAASRPTPVDALDADTVTRATETFLRTPVTVAVDQATTALPWSELGAGLDGEALTHAVRIARRALASELAGAAPEAVPGEDAVLRALARAGSLPVAVDRTRAEAAMATFKARYDRAPRDARMDLENRTIHHERPGISVDVYASMSAIAAAAQSGADRVDLHTIALAPETTVADLGIDDVSHSLARFETKYSVSDHIRNFNLKLAADKLDGYVVQPGEEFSFNEAVGPRTEKEGYRVAGVISAGEMVDGLAGGLCQISTTLHGAAFFAGLDIVRALPHSRPSTYVTMGLDATVVYPHVDLKLSNPYDFPVAIHFRVTQGSVVVELLGKERPYDEVEYERNIVEKLEFHTITREDDAMPIGSMSIDQYGFYGYMVEKIRKFYKDGKVVKRDKWKIRYQPVTEYVRNGINPDPNLMPPAESKADKKKRKKRLKEPDMDRAFRMAQ